MTTTDPDRLELEQRLRVAFDRFHAPQELDPNDDPEIEHNQRLGIVRALDAVLSYLRAPGDINCELFDPLIRLMGAFADVDNGGSSPIFERRRLRPKGGRPGKAHYREMDLATAAAAVTRLMQAGSTEAAALRKVAAAIRAPEKKLRNWRDDLKRGRKTEAARDWYDQVVKPNFANGESTESLLEALLSLHPK